MKLYATKSNWTVGRRPTLGLKRILTLLPRRIRIACKAGTKIALGSEHNPYIFIVAEVTEDSVTIVHPSENEAYRRKWVLHPGESATYRTPSMDAGYNFSFYLE